ncbi:hypothetical protein HU200_048956 [Digitaria exilis]|uniref:Uncharacterized protein n=1 Tax=Digitaria exilis TaxID=1010633 RepID=A0A835B110_9POAL|nr:hypothetical protein HU200_048956 [Digitaria exilis]
MSSSTASSMGSAGVPMTASSIVADAVTGSHVLKIEGYSRTKGLGNGKSIKSRAFDVGGHRWYITYYPDGYGSDNAGWIVFFLILQHTDAKSDVKASFKFCLIDEMGEPVQSYCNAWSEIRPFKVNGCYQWGYSRLIEKAALEESGYLKDDCFRIRCDVMVSREFCLEDTTQFVKVPSSDIHQHIGNLLSSGAEADVTFQVGEETVAAHRLILGARSSVFMAELFGPMKEKHASHIQIHDMDPGVFRAMIHFIYTDTLSDMDKGNTFFMAQHLLVAADRYDLQRLKLICEDKLCNFISSSTAATTLALAEQHGCKRLKEACFKFLRSPGNLKTIMDNDGFKHLTSSCPSILNELLANVAP